MYQKLQTGRATAMAELLSDTIDNVNLNNVVVSSAATPGSGGTVLVDTSLDTGAELVTNGDFSATGSELVVDGDFTATGSELVTNGDFATDSDWTKIDGATISGGKAHIDGDGTTFTSISQAPIFTAGKSYIVTADVTITSGLGLKFQDGANNENIGFATTSGSYTFYFVATSDTTLVIGRRTGGTAFESSVDNVSVKELGEDWTLGAGWSVGDSEAISDGTNAAISQSVMNAEKSYKITATVTGSPSLLVFSSSSFYGVTADRTLINGTNTYYLQSKSTNLSITNAGSDACTITNISVQELGEDWTDTGAIVGLPAATFNADGLTITSVNGNGNDNRVNQANVTEAAKSYKVTYTIYAATLTGTNVIQYFNGLTYVPLPEQGVGTHTFTYTRLATNKNWIFRINPTNGSTTDFVTISYISVEESENAGFVPIGVKVGDIVYNTASIPNVATVVGISPDGDTLTLSNDISVTSGVPYKILSRTNSAATLYIGTVGVSATLKVRTAGGDDVTLDNLVQGTTLPTQVVRVYNTGTANVSNILALF